MARCAGSLERRLGRGGMIEVFVTYCKFIYSLCGGAKVTLWAVRQHSLNREALTVPGSNCDDLRSSIASVGAYGD
jgi:hypothetical protein